jgi:hypothetical protein
MTRYSGKGWHFQHVRHSNAKKYGKAGGKYAGNFGWRYPKNVFIDEKKLKENLEKIPRKDKIDFLMKSGLHKREQLENMSEKQLDEFTEAGLEATGFKFGKPSREDVTCAKFLHIPVKEYRKIKKHYGKKRATLKCAFCGRIDVANNIFKLNKEDACRVCYYAYTHDKQGNPIPFVETSKHYGKPMKTFTKKEKIDVALSPTIIALDMELEKGKYGYTLWSGYWNSDGKTITTTQWSGVKLGTEKESEDVVMKRYDFLKRYITKEIPYGLTRPEIEKRILSIIKSIKKV